MANHAIQLDLDEFRDAFLPSPGFSIRTRTGALSEHFIKSINQASLVPGFTLSCLSRSNSFGDAIAQSMDTAFCRGHYFPRSRRRPSWADQSIPVEFKSHSWGVDPFDNVQVDGEDSAVAIERRELFDHILTTARLLFAVQHRVVLFMLLVIGRKFRLLRWDHAGVIATPSFDYYGQSAVLCDLLQRFSHLDDAAPLGFDLSATRLCPGRGHFSWMDAAAVPQHTDIDHNAREMPNVPSHETPVFEYVCSLFRTWLADDWPRYKLVVPHTTGFRKYLVGKPLFVSQVMFGRGTRGYVALDCQTGRFLWLKDTWRTSYMFADREGDILQRRNEAGVDNIPTLFSHGDVRDQVTIASNWIGNPRPAPSHAAGPVPTLSPPSHTHPTSGTPGSRKRKREADADGDHAGHHIGGERSSDVTIGSNDPLSQHRHYRIVVEEGTYQFMSVNALQRPSHSVTIVDELESFYHVLLYFCGCFLRSTCKDRTSWIDNYFHLYSGPDHGFTCGQKSITMEVTGKLRTLPPQRPLIFDSPVDGVFSTLLPCFKARCKVLSYEIMKATVPSPVPEIPEPPRSPSAHEIPIVPKRSRKLTESAIALREEVQKELAEWTPYDDETLSVEDVLRDASWPEDDRILPAQPLSPVVKPIVPDEPPQAAEPAPPRKRQKRAAPSRPSQLGPVPRCAVPAVKLAAYLSPRDRSHDASTFSQPALDLHVTLKRPDRTRYLALGSDHASGSFKTRSIDYANDEQPLEAHSFFSGRLHAASLTSTLIMRFGGPHERHLARALLPPSQYPFHYYAPKPPPSESLWPRTRDTHL
ncbi:hypothetical protein DICSQDRAFT_174933 [Dichomitus squalens LYAD-421 SS1]|uniref:Fungal-type protein kinase domain-containing protein n=1 Tax=Dichomitus squalens (strain LYAD-421) TaxID=732165 RepID=R7SN42_DICSQ|nr:uncharacterized protein DICSQDRAFT_174933 [Dichomitus squalens LYAD-421 SS1]EJF56417.1 hypothetical protein DICSQDRAFT_174933 [Dichomitus squalens LYAD-421 SS1]